MNKNQIAASSPNAGMMKSKSRFTRREMLELTGVAGVAGFTGISSDAVAQTSQKRPRIACLVSYWGLPTSHADWIVNKLLDGYWWHGAHTPSGVEVVSVYIDQFDTSLLGQKVCKAKNIPIFKTVPEAVTLGGEKLAVDGVVIVAEHGNYRTDLKGHWLLPRWWIYQQVMKVFEQSKRSVPVFNDKHLSYSWNESKWMFDKSRELNFPLTGGSSIPTYFRTPEIELAVDTPIKNSIVVGDTADEGAIFHCIDVLQAFVDRRKGGETGVKAVQSIRGPETWAWVERNAWAGDLLEAVRTKFDLKPGHFQESRRPPNLCVLEYNDGTKAAVIPGQGVGWTYAGEIEGQKRAHDCVDAWLPWPHLAVPCCERVRALGYRDDADAKRTVQRGALASVHGHRQLLHGLELGGRPLLCGGAPYRDAVPEYEVPLHTRAPIRIRAEAAEYSLYPRL